MSFFIKRIVPYFHRDSYTIKLIKTNMFSPLMFYHSLIIFWLTKFISFCIYYVIFKLVEANNEELFLIFEEHGLFWNNLIGSLLKLHFSDRLIFCLTKTNVAFWWRHQFCNRLQFYKHGIMSHLQPFNDPYNWLKVIKKVT